MSKKQKRSVSNVTTDQMVSETSTATPSPRRFSSQASEFNPDYSHVKAGLKRIAILATSAIVVLIILTLILK